MLQSRKSRTVRPVRSSLVSRLLMEALDDRTLMSATPVAVAPPAPTQAALAAAVMAAASTTPVPVVATANVRVGTDPNSGNLVVVSYNPNPGQPVAPATINLNMFHDYSHNTAEVSISANGNNVTMPLNRSLIVTANCADTVNFNAYDTQLLGDYVPYISIRDDGGAVYETSVVPLTVDAGYVYKGDTGFYNSSDFLSGKTVICQPGGSTMSANADNAYLYSGGPIASRFFTNGYQHVLVIDGAGDSTAYVSSGNTVLMGAGNDQVHLNSWDSGSSTSTFIDVGTGYDQVTLHGQDPLALVTITSSGGGAYVEQYDSIGHLSFYSTGGMSTLNQDLSLEPVLQQVNVLNVNWIYSDLVNGGGGKG